MGFERARGRFFALTAERLAQRLIGCRLVRVLADGTRLSGVIVETEAYVGPEDACSHAAGGRRTARTATMFMRPGTAYVYFTYGMHHCMNVVCDREGHPAAVLLRALEPGEGVEVMRSMSTPGLREHLLCSGPGRLCRAMAIDRAMDATDLTSGPSMWIERPTKRSAVMLVNTPRIGVSGGGRDRDPVASVWVRRALRWAATGSRSVSGGKAGGRAAAAGRMPSGA
jgi:DNA-3-methyladenine glycosylase